MAGPDARQGRVAFLQRIPVAVEALFWQSLGG